jgi:hypothetical protein
VADARVPGPPIRRPVPARPAHPGPGLAVRVRPTLLQPEDQSQVGVEAYDTGARILQEFFAEELSQFLTPGLDPLGREIIETCLRGGTVRDYEEITPMFL